MIKISTFFFVLLKFPKYIKMKMTKSITKVGESLKLKQHTEKNELKY
jgi:hypothetical protein